MPSGRVMDQVVLTADSGFNSERAVQAVLERGIEAYIADPMFRKRDPKFANQQAYNQKTTDRKHTVKKGRISRIGFLSLNKKKKWSIQPIRD